MVKKKVCQKIDVEKTGVKNHDTKKLGSKCCWVPKNNRQQKFRVKMDFKKIWAT